MPAIVCHHPNREETGSPHNFDQYDGVNRMISVTSNDHRTAKRRSPVLYRFQMKSLRHDEFLAIAEQSAFNFGAVNFF